MKLSKLEPHVVQPAPDEDVGLFLKALDKETAGASPVMSSPESDPGVNDSKEEVKAGFVRLVDFLSQRKGKGWQSRRSMACRAYQRQKMAFLSQNDQGSDLELNAVS